MIGESVLTAAGLGVGIGFAVARASAAESADSAKALVDKGAQGNPAACAMPEGDVAYACDDLSAALAHRDRASTLSTVGFVTAGVGAAALVSTWLFYPSPRAHAAGFSVTPVAGLGRVGVLGRF